MKIELGWQWYRFLRFLSRLDKEMYIKGLRSREKLYLPHFLVIGAPKSGTTWLFDNLRCHPEIFIPEVKEVAFFGRFLMSLKSYSSIFSDGKDKVRGEVSPLYAILPKERVRIIRQLIPELKLLYILRDPVDRVWSHTYMEVVEKKKRSLADASLEDFEEFFGSPKSQCKESSQYVENIEKWLEFFSQNQFRVLLYDDIPKNPKGLLLKLFAFLGVDNSPDWTQFPLNQMILPAYNSDGSFDKAQRGSTFQNPRLTIPDLVKTLIENQVNCDDMKLVKSRYRNLLLVGD